LLLAILIPLVYSRAPLHLGDPTLVVPNQYMVVLHDNVTVEARDAHIEKILSAKRLVSEGVEENVFFRWHVTLVGYAAQLSKESVNQLLDDPLVRWVEADQVVTLLDDQEEQIQVDPQAWGLRRIDQVDFIFNDDTYTYWASGGSGVDVYIIDTGILTSHVEFDNGRATFGTNTVIGEQPVDCNGHGTHVASTAAGHEYGVAKYATLIAVKVLGCGGSGTWSGVEQGIEWTTTSFQSRKRPSVANMSLGGGISPTTDLAVEKSIAAGVSYAIAAGNNGGIACNYSPARVPTAITVGATTYSINPNPEYPSQDVRASFSNYGTCVDLFAPGQNIKAAWIGNSNTATSVISGTSMASPHVAGVAAVALGHLLADGHESGFTPAELEAYLVKVATPDHLSNPGSGSPNLIVYSPYAY